MKISLLITLTSNINLDKDKKGNQGKNEHDTSRLMEAMNSEINSQSYSKNDFTGQWPTRNSINPGLING